MGQVAGGLAAAWAGSVVVVAVVVMVVVGWPDASNFSVLSTSFHYLSFPPTQRPLRARLASPIASASLPLGYKPMENRGGSVLYDANESSAHKRSSLYERNRAGERRRYEGVADGRLHKNSIN